MVPRARSVVVDRLLFICPTPEPDDQPTQLLDSSLCSSRTKTKLNFTFIEVNFHTWENLFRKKPLLAAKNFHFFPSQSSTQQSAKPAKLALIDSPTFIRQTKKLDIFLKQSAAETVKHCHQSACNHNIFSFSHSCFYIFNYLHQRHKETTSVRTEILCEISFFT